VHGALVEENEDREGEGIAERAFRVCHLVAVIE
jgi:hypothetical protein